MTRRALYPALALTLAALAAGWLLGRRGDASDLLARQDERLALAAERLHDLSLEAGIQRTRADSLARVAGRSSDTAIVYITRWRMAVDTLPVDTAAIVAAFPGLVAAGDSLAAACEAAADDCATALAAKDAALIVQDSVLAAERERAAALERYREELADRLSRRIRAQRWRTARDVVVGAALGVTFCAVAGC